MLSGGCRVRISLTTLSTPLREQAAKNGLQGDRDEHMTNRPTRGRLELEVADFGPIVDAKIDLRPLTVFVGPSNTGKSYLAILIYALHQFFCGGSPRYGPRVARTPWLFLHERPEKLSETDHNAIMEWLDRTLEDADTRRDPLGIALPDTIADITRRIMSNTKGTDDYLRTEISRCFGVGDTADLVRLRIRDGARVVLRNHVPDAGNDTEPFVFSIALTSSRITLLPSLPPATPIRIGRGSDKTVDRHLSRLRRMLSNWTRAGSGSRYGWNVLYDLAEIVVPYITGPLYSPAFYLPADRTGVMHAHRVVVSTLVERAAMAGLRSPPRTPMMSGILADFLEQLIELDEPRRSAGRSGKDLGERIEQAMLRGSIGIVRSESGYPSFVYRPDDWKRDLPLMNASSMVSELAPVVLYLRHVVRAGDLLIIEEPESHLHPEMQAVLARELARIVGAGIRIIVTTHSEWFLEQIGNLVRRSALPASEQGDAALNERDVGVWLFSSRKRPKGSVVSEAKLDPETGLFSTDYESVSESLYNEGARVYNRLQEIQAK